MKKQFFITLVSILLLTACSKEKNLAVEVVAMWQLTEMWDGDEVEYHDDIFYSFQNSLINIKQVYRGMDNNSLNYYGRYFCNEDSIYFTLYHDKENTIIPELRLGDEYEVTHQFKIEELTGSQMVWTRGEDERFVFRKY